MLSQISTDQQSNSHIQSIKTSESNASSTLTLKVPDQSETLSEQIHSRKVELDSSQSQGQQQLSSIGRWTDEEHKRFEEGLAMFHKDWKLVEKHVGTRSSAQIRSHAQKYFNKQHKMRKAQQLNDGQINCSSFCCGRTLDDPGQLFGSSQQIWKNSCICRDSNSISHRIQQSNHSANQSLHSNQAHSISDQFKCKIQDNQINSSTCPAKCSFSRNPSSCNDNTNQSCYSSSLNTYKEENTQNAYMKYFLKDNNSHHHQQTSMDSLLNLNHQNYSFSGSILSEQQQQDNFPSLFKQSLLSHLSNLLRMSAQQEYQPSMNQRSDLDSQIQNFKQSELTDISKLDREVPSNNSTQRTHAAPQDLKRKNSFSLCSQQLSHSESSLMKVEQFRKKLCTERGPQPASSTSSTSCHTMIDNSAKNVLQIGLSSSKNEITNPIGYLQNSSLLAKNPSSIIKDRQQQQQQSPDNSSILFQDPSKLDQTSIVFEAFQRFLQQQQEAASNYQAQQSSQLNSLILDLTKSITQNVQVSSKQG